MIPEGASVGAMNERPERRFLSPHRKHAVAGCIAGLSTVLILQPLDVVKTRLQGQLLLRVCHALAIVITYKG